MRADRKGMRRERNITKMPRQDDPEAEARLAAARRPGRASPKRVRWRKQLRAEAFRPQQIIKCCRHCRHPKGDPPGHYVSCPVCVRGNRRAR